MGWWGAGVMDGDAPLDLLGELCGVMGVGFDYDDAQYHYTREQVEDHVAVMVDKISAIRGDEYQRVAYHVLGYMVLKVGADIPDGVRTSIICAAQEDDWAAESEERASHMNQLAREIQNHCPGICVELTGRGLIEVISNYLDN